MSSFMAADVNFMFSPSAKRSRKYCASMGMSERRSRKDGREMLTTLRRK